MTGRLELYIETPSSAKADNASNRSLSLQGLNLLAADRQENRPKVELKPIPGSQLKFDNGVNEIEKKANPALPDLTAEQLKEMAEKPGSTIKTCKQISDLLSKPSLSDEEKLRLQGFAEKLNSDITMLFDRSHNYERPLITDQLLASNDGLNESLDKNWQQLQILSKQCRDQNQTLSLALHSPIEKDNATATADLTQGLTKLSSALAKLEYPLSNLRTNTFTKKEQEEYEQIKKRRAGYVNYSKSEGDLQPFRKEYDLLKPYFEMIDIYKELYSDSLHLTCSSYSKPREDALLNNIGLQASSDGEHIDDSLLKDQAQIKPRLEQNLDKFLILFNDPNIAALESNNNIEPFIREEMIDFRKMGRWSIKGLQRLRAFLPNCDPNRQSGKLFDMSDHSNMISPADELWNYEDAFKTKLKYGAKHETFTKIDSIK